MSIAPLRHTSIRRKLLTLALAAGLAFITVSALFALSWRDLEKVSARVSSTYIPTLRDGAAALVSVSAVGTELFRYVNQIEPSAYRVADALEGARAALQRIAGSDIPPEIRANIDALLPQVAAQEAGLQRLTARVERDDALGIGEAHTRMAAEAGVMLRSVERINGQLLDSIVEENRSGVQRSLERAALAIALGLLLVAGALLFMVLVRRDLERGIAGVQAQVQRYAEDRSKPVEPIERLDEIGQLSRFISALANDVRETGERLRQQLKFISDVFDSVPLSLAFRDTGGRIRMVNRSWEQSFGYRRDDALGKTLAELGAMPGANASDASRSAAEDQRALALGPGKSTEPREILLRGRQFLQTRSVMSNAQGDFIGLLVTGLDITDQKRHEAEAANNAKFIQDLFDSMPLSLAFRDTQGRFRMVNRTWEQYFGFSREQTLGRTPADLAALPGGADPAEVARIAAEDQRAIDLGAGKSTEPREILLRGRHRPHSGHYLQTRTAMADAEGHITGILITGLDISEQKRHEIDAANKAKFIEHLVESVPVSISYRDLQGRYQLVNRTWEKYFRSKRGQVIGKTLHELMPPELADPIEAEHRAALERGADAPAEQFDLLLRGRRYLQTRTAMTDAAGNTIGLLLSARDITDEHETQQALETQRQRLELVVKASQAGIVDWDGVTRKGWYSDLLKALLGFPPDTDTSSWTFFDRVHPEDWERVRASLIEHLKGNNPANRDSLSREYRMRRADGSYVWVQSMGLSLRDASGRSARFLSAITDISERRAQEEALRTQEQRLALVVRAAQVGIIDWDAKTRRAWHSDRFKTLLGHAPDTDTSGWPDVFELIHAEDRPRVYAAHIDHLKNRGVPGGESPHDAIEYRLRCADGSYRWVQGIGLSLCDATGRATRFIAAITDISERRAQEETLRDQIKLTRDLIDGNPNPVYLKDEHCRFLEVNTAYTELTRVTPDKAKGQTVFDLYQTESAAVFDRQDRELLARGEGTSAIEVDYQFPEKRRHFLMSKTILKRADGTVRGLIGTLTEITQIKEIEETLRDQMELTRDLIRALPNPLFLKDEQFRFVHVNPAWEKVAAVPAEKAIGRVIPEVYPPEYAEEFLAQDRALLAQGVGIHSIEVTIPGRKGPRQYILSKSLLRREDGSLRGMIGSMTDITRLKRTETELRASREEALLAAQAKAAFLAAMSHEIRTPLNGVLGMAGLLEGTALTPEQREYVETIQVSGDALLAVINDILDYSKIESGRMELEQAPLEPVRAIEESLEILGARARAKGLELIAETDDGLPPWVLGDLARLRQVLVNLVGNAVKFTDAGEILVSARSPEPGVLEFAVHDSGIGIPQDRIGSLFEAFSQVDVSTTRKYGGTGLGLAISRRLVEFMGGELRVESEPGRGSTFSFRVRAQPCAPLPLPKSALAAADALRGKRLLVVDDNETNRRILAHQLERWGAAQVAEGSAAAALERLAADRAFDAALFDYHMPGMDGVMLARELRRRGLKLPIVLLSSSMYRRAEEAEAELFAAQLLKPIRQQQLQAAIAAAIAGERFEPATARRAQPGEGRLAERLPLRILVADDVEVNRRLTVALLRNFGYSADAVESGREAVAAAERYDLVLMDVQMPDVDGLEATRQIRAAQRRGARGPRIVALTASAMAGDRERCLEAGMDDYLAKPLQPQALRAALEQVGRGAARQAGRKRAAQPAAAIDWSRIESLKPFDPDGSMVAGAIGAFLADAPRRIRAIRKAHAAGNAPGLASAAHALKGAAANIGAARLRELSQAIESLARDGRPAEARKAIGGLQKSLAAARAALAKGRASRGS